MSKIKKKTAYSIEINNQLKVLQRLHKAETIAFKLFYSPKSPVYDYIKASIEAELDVSWDALLRLSDPNQEQSEEFSEELELTSQKINYDLNQLLVQTALLQDAFAVIEKINFDRKDAAQVCWVNLQAQILDMCKQIMAKIPEQHRFNAKPSPRTELPEPAEDQADNAI
jgi:CHAT domain-containing protein